jgi:outer membrane beta-barrel protein
MKQCIATSFMLVLASVSLAHADEGAPSPTTTPPVGNELSSTSGACVDAVIAERLAIKRKRRGAIDRLFVKQARHELTAFGGYYNSDLFSSTYVAGGAYTFHMTEQTAVEFAGAYTHANADIIRALEDKRGQLLADTFERVIFAEALLVWHPVYGKLRFGGAIARFDLDLSLGVGVVDSSASRGADGVLGVGLKLFAGRAWAVRFDLRNRTFYQDLLDQRQLVNDTSATLGVSLFLPVTQ